MIYLFKLLHKLRYVIAALFILTIALDPQYAKKVFEDMINEFLSSL